MVRSPRPDLAGVAQHIIQRGNDRTACFRDDRDRRHYLTSLGHMALRYNCAIHAYALMTNHVHLLVTPVGVGAVSRMMQGIGRWYVSEFNIRHGRTGTLWEGRYKSCLVDTETYLLACYRYIELNPVRAGLVDDPSDYPWSSYVVNSGAQSSALVRPHEAYLTLGSTRETRGQAYRNLVRTAMPDELLREIRTYTQQQRALGTAPFQTMVGEKLGRRVVATPTPTRSDKRAL
jgi:putative transposase